MQTDSDDQGRLQDRHEPDQERPAGRELILGWGPVRQRRRSGRMRRAYVPKDGLVLETQLVEDPMDDRRRVLDVTAPVEARPALRWEGPLGREGDSGEPTACIPGCLPDQHQRGARPSSKMVRQVRQPNRRRTWPVEGRIGLAVGIERRADLSSGEIVQQAIERVHFQIIARALRGADANDWSCDRHDASIVRALNYASSRFLAKANSSSVSEPCSRRPASRSSSSTTRPPREGSGGRPVEMR
jgi:hypothetical protein